MDENFLLYRKRAIELLQRMKEHDKSWALYVFASANAIRKYTMEELVELGIAWIWMGLESPHASYTKLKGTDTHQLTRELRLNGIKVLGSSIVGLEHHTPQNIREEIDYAVAHDTDFHQFMLYTPVPGTPLHQQMAEQGKLLDVDLADIHGQYKFNFKHAAISADESKVFLDRAFIRDFDRNGPSLYRICRTTFEGWKRYRHYPDLRVRARFEREISEAKAAYGGILWAMERQLKKSNQAVSERIRELRQQMAAEFGFAAQLTANILGPLLLWTTRREEKRLANGKTYEPETIIERRNWIEA